MGLCRSVLVAVLLPVCLGASAPEVVRTPCIRPAERASFDQANRSLYEESYARACEAFGAFLEDHPATRLAREAKVKRSCACERAGRRSLQMDEGLREIADGGPVDLARGLANLWLHRRGEGYLDSDHRGRWKAAVSQLEAVASGAGGRSANEARRALVDALFDEIDRRPSGPEALALAERILALRPGTAGYARAYLARGRLLLGDRERAAQGERDLRAAGGTRSEWADDALFELAVYYEGRGLFGEALALYERIVERFDPGTSDRHSEAVSRAAQLRDPRLDLVVAETALPGASPKAHLFVRNVSQVRFTLRRADPFAVTDPRLMLAPGAPPAGVPGVEIRSWSESVGTRRRHEPGQKTLELQTPGPGVYLLEAAAGELVRSVPVVVTPFASVVKMSRDQLAVWTADARTGQAAAGAEVVAFVEVGGGEYRRLEGLSDAGGLCLLEVEDARLVSAAVWSRKGQGHAFARARASQRPDASPELLAYLLADRPLYGPGEEVGVRLFLRSREGGPSSPAAATEVTVTTYDPSDRVIDRRNLKTSELGTASFALALGDRAQLGAYRFHVHDNRLGISQSKGGFRVEEHKAPEPTVSLEPMGKPRPDETVKVLVSASSSCGGPLANAHGRAVVTEEPWSHSWKPWPDGQPADGAGSEGPHGGPGAADPRQGQWGYVGVSRTIELTTDAEGKAALELSPSKDLRGDRSFRVRVYLTDTSRREITGSATVRASSSPWFVDVWPDRVLYKPGERIAVRLRAEDANGRPESPAVDVRLVRLGNDGSRSEVLKRSVQLESGEGLVELDADALGPARVEVRARGDSEKGALLASSDIWLTGEAKPIVPATGGLQVITDRGPLKVGSTVRALVVTKGSGGHVLLSLENGRVHLARSLEVKGRARFVELPLTAEMAPNVFLTASRLEQLQFRTQQAALRVAGADAELGVETLFPRPAADPGSAPPRRDSVGAFDERPPRAEVAVAPVEKGRCARDPELDELLGFFGRRAQQHAVSTVASVQGWPFGSRGARPRAGRPEAGPTTR